MSTGSDRTRGFHSERRVRRARSLRSSGDRWLFGYADIVTLLFACFASLYATGLPAAATPTVAAPVISPAPEPPPPPAAVPELDPNPIDTPDLENALEQRLTSNPQLPGVEIVPDHRGLVISLPEAGSFPPGRTELSPAAHDAILDLAVELSRVPNLIRVEGHTDDVPIRTAEFLSNWDLSASRATRVVRLLIDEGRLDPVRLSAAGYAEHRPRQPNASPAARARNRRVDIVVLDASSWNGEPEPEPSDTQSGAQP
jgi:chemotaxis protein MotB